MLAFRAARYFIPLKLNELKPTATDIESEAVSFLLCNSHRPDQA